MGKTLPPHYSSEMRRYEPPLPIKKREQEKALEKVREMTNGGSKEIKVKSRQRVKPNSLGIIRNWNPTQGLKHQSPKEVQENLNLQRKRLIKESLQRFSPNVKEIMMKKIVLNFCLKK